MQELKSFNNPPPLVEVVLCAVCLLFGMKERSAAHELPISSTCHNLKMGEQLVSTYILRHFRLYNLEKGLATGGGTVFVCWKACLCFKKGVGAKKKTSKKH